jgi:hypothetical protein
MIGALQTIPTFFWMYALGDCKHASKSAAKSRIISSCGDTTLVRK